MLWGVIDVLGCYEFRLSCYDWRHWSQAVTVHGGIFLPVFDGQEASGIRLMWNLA